MKVFFLVLMDVGKSAKPHKICMFFSNFSPKIVAQKSIICLVVCTFIPTFWTFHKQILDTKHIGKAMSTTFEITCKKISCSPCISNRKEQRNKEMSFLPVMYSKISQEFISSTSIQSKIPTTFKYKNSNHPICFYLGKKK